MEVRHLETGGTSNWSESVSLPAQNHNGIVMYEGAGSTYVVGCTYDVDLMDHWRSAKGL